MIDIRLLKRNIINQATTGQLSRRLEGDSSVSDIIDELPPLSSRRKKLLEQVIDMDAAGDIPSHWQWVKLGEISTYGDTPQKVKPTDISDDTWILDLEDVESGGRLLVKRYGLERMARGEKNVFRKGQVLYSKLRPYLHKVLVADEDGVSTPELVSFDVFAGINPVYITYCLTNSYVSRVIEKRSYGIKMPRIDPAFMANLPIPLPPSEEQKRIVELVSQSFAELQRIDEAQKAFALDVDALRRRIIETGMRGDLSCTWRETHDINRKSTWVNCKLIDALRGRPQNGTSQKPVDYETPCRNLILSAVTSGVFMPEYFKYVDLCLPEDSRFWLMPDDILLQRSNSLEKVGTSALYTGGPREFIYPDLMMKLQVNEKAYAPFIAYQLKTRAVMEYLRSHATGTAGNMPKVNQKVVSEIPITLPSYDEQVEIASRLDELLAALPT